MFCLDMCSGCRVLFCLSVYCIAEIAMTFYDEKEFENLAEHVQAVIDRDL